MEKLQLEFEERQKRKKRQHQLNMMKMKMGAVEQRYSQEVTTNLTHLSSTDGETVACSSQTT